MKKLYAGGVSVANLLSRLSKFFIVNAFGDTVIQRFPRHLAVHFDKQHRTARG